MKNAIKIFCLAALVAVGFNSCSEDDFGPSIFDIPSGNIDQNAYTAQLDSFVKKCFLIPYNVDFKYKMEDISSDVNKNLIPASLDKCKELAVLTKYLWYDVYKYNVGDSIAEGELLLKKYSPRIIHLIGSKNINPITGTEVLGETANGIMITLFRCNMMSVDNIDYCNEYFFKTMHHEFGHMLCSNYVVPTDYRKITSGSYDALSWQDTSDSVALGQGYISQYSRNNYEDDFVEMFSVYLTSTDKQWQDRLNTSHWTWEEVELEYDYWRKFNTKVLYGQANVDTVGYLKSVSTKNDGKCTVIRKKVKREDIEEYDENGKMQYAHAVLDENGEIQFLGEGGYDYIITKFGILREYLTEKYNIDIDRLRDDINRRCYYMDEEGNFIMEDGQIKNRVKDVLPQLLDDLENYNF